jgi:hypothetical protein
MPSMDWEDFQRDHHRPHLLIVSVNGTKAQKRLLGKAEFERLAVRLGASGNYAIRVEGATIYAAFESDKDAKRFEALLRPQQATRELEWASKVLARVDETAYQRIVAIFKKPRLRSRRRKSPPVGSRGR